MTPFDQQCAQGESAVIATSLRRDLDPFGHVANAAGAGQPAWDFPRSLAGVRGATSVAASHEVPAEELLAGTGLTQDVLSDPGVVVKADIELRVVRNLMGLLGDADELAIELGSRSSIAALGAFGLAALSSTTLREALLTTVRFIGLSTVFVSLTSEDQVDGGAAVTLDGAQIPADVRRFLTVRDLTSLVRISIASFGASFQPEEGPVVETILDARACGHLATIAPGAQLIGERAIDKLRFSGRQLDMVLPTADPTTAKICATQCEDILARRRHRDNVRSAVIACLRRNPEYVPTIGQVAAELGMSERSLRRRLWEENTSYRQLLDETRAVLAARLLATTELPVERIAERLGYAESASFTRAFHRWRGVPPGRFRRQHPDGPSEYPLPVV